MIQDIQSGAANLVMWMSQVASRRSTPKHLGNTLCARDIIPGILVKLNLKTLEMDLAYSKEKMCGS